MMLLEQKRENKVTLQLYIKNIDFKPILCFKRKVSCILRPEDSFIAYFSCYMFLFA